MDGQFEGGKFVGSDVELATDVLRAVALREEGKNFDLAIVENVERRPGRVRVCQDLVKLCPCHRINFTPGWRAPYQVGRRIVEPGINTDGTEESEASGVGVNFGIGR